MTKIKDISDYTESFAPLSTQADFDNSGLLVGDPQKEVHTVLVTLDITAQAVEEARELDASLIISHHPVIFTPIKSLDSKSVPYLLAKYGISALCLHTNLDRAEDCGVNVCLAQALELSDVSLYPDEFMALGKPKRVLPVKLFANDVKRALGCERVEYILGDNIVRTVAVSSGAGGSGFKTAKALGADLLITGEAKHHELLEAHALGMPMIVAGHFHTEDVVIAPLCKKLSEKFPEVFFKKSENYKWISHKI
ncbi:MAG: Nif3-like dinuclear metal center hexameric protein [Eubacteriales bacterium]|nr:Nif3-like dinuclear metal center hexameric protein [Eubacteriales bacterium]